MGAGGRLRMRSISSPTSILGYTNGQDPRHSKVYRDFAAEYARLQEERIAAVPRVRADVESGAFPEERYLVRMDEGEFAAFRDGIEPA